MSGFRRPSWWAVLLTVGGALLFMRLGVWQLHRADFKEALLRRYAASATAPQQDFAAVALHPPADAFPRIAVRGHYRADRIYLLDNPGHDERGGVEVFVPFKTEGTARLLLVDLGFLAGNGSSAVPALPAIPAGVVSLHGLYVPPPPTGFRMGGDALAAQKNWPKNSIYIALEEVAADLGQPLFPRVLALDPDPSVAYQRARTLDLSSMPPARHRAYAFQWFSFALAALVILLVVHRKREQPKPMNPNDEDSR